MLPPEYQAPTEQSIGARVEEDKSGTALEQSSGDPSSQRANISKQPANPADSLRQYPLTRHIKINSDSERGKNTKYDKVNVRVNTILRELQFAKDDNNNLYNYRDGVYVAGGEKVISELVCRMYENGKDPSKWSSRKERETVRAIIPRVPLLWAEPSREWMSIANGRIHLPTATVHPHITEYLSTVQLPVNYAPNADCPIWRQFILDTFPDDASELAWKIAALLIDPSNDVQKLILLHGEGANGKSIFLTALSGFLGRNNVSAVPLHKLESDRFAGAQLRGKLANICADISDVKLETSGTLKSITGGDVISAEYKYRDSFQFVPTAKLLFSANQLPRSRDESKAFYDRFVIVPFTKTFPRNPAKKRELEAALSQPGELSGVLNMALSVLPVVREQGLTLPASLEKATAEYRGLSDPLGIWLREHVEPDSGEFIPRKWLLEAFNMEQRADGMPEWTEQQFGRQLRLLRPEIGDGQRTVEGKARTRVYTGIRFKHPEYWLAMFRNLEVPVE